jgi:hypothetical protein
MPATTTRTDEPRALWALRLSVHERADLDEVANSLGVTRSDAVRLGIVALKERCGAP